MALKETLNANFKQLQEENKVNNAYLTGQISTEKKMFKQVKEMKRSTFDRSKFTVVGNPTITDDGIASGFSDSNYIKSSYVNLSNANSWSIKLLYTFSTNNTNYSQAMFYYGGNSKSRLTAYNNRGGVQLVLTNSTLGDIVSAQVLPDYTLQNGITYNIELKFTGTEYKILIDGVEKYSLSSSAKINSGDGLFSIFSGFGRDATFGPQNLKQFSITVDGVEVFNGNKTGIDQIKKDNFTKVGSPIITDDGIASGFSANSYLTTPSIIQLGNYNNWELNLDFTVTSPADTQWIFITGINGWFGGIQVSTIEGKLNIKIGSTETSDTDIMFLNSLNTTIGNYKLQIKFTGTEYIVTYRFNNGNIIEYGRVSTSTKVYNVLTFQDIGSHNSQPFYGSIDLNSFKIYVDEQLVYQPTLRIPYTQSKTGSKIVDAVYRDRIQDVYEQYGQANYYTLSDTDVTLPMGEVYGLIETAKQSGGSSTSGYHPPLLSCMWSDHLLNDIQWLRADTFSWQDGNVYKTVYDKLLEEFNNGYEEWVEGIGNCRRTPEGFKIFASWAEARILNKYNTDGIAWCYIIDAENKRFKLPRTKFGFEGLRNNVGDDIAESLPKPVATVRQGSTNIGSDYGNTGNRFVTQGEATNTTTTSLFATTSTYQDNAPVQERATQMYLYFYVGEYTREAVEQTAGLNSEMFNSKQDVCTHITSTYIDGTSGYRIWSDGYCEQRGQLAGTSSSLHFVKTFKDINYVFNINARSSNGGDTLHSMYFGKTTTGITNIGIGQYSAGMTTSSNYTHEWKASGYLAEGEF